jgi:hypothetical protein
MTKPIQLHVGYVGVTRKGNRVEITEFREKNGHYQWLAGDDESYRKDGSYLLTVTSDLDIVGPWVEATKLPINYNDGKWHQWNGSKCPVHPNSIVEMIAELNHGRIDAGRPASSFDWDHDPNPILVFRVTEEYVAPKELRELWVSENDYQAHETEADAQEYDKTLGHNHGYFRVKEVM